MGGLEDWEPWNPDFKMWDWSLVLEGFVVSLA